MKVDRNCLFGNEALLSFLSDRISERNAPHAYLLEGPEGSGKKTLALWLAEALNCRNEEAIPCGRCRFCRTIAAMQSPDVFWIGMLENTAKKSIGVDEIRAIAETIYLLPNDLETKIYIIPDADTMTTQAQNAFLKLLEEPPSYVLFLLLCENRYALLPTVRSRVQLLTMERFSEEVLREWAMRNCESAPRLSETKPEVLSTAVRLADGSIGRLKAFLALSEKDREKHPYFEACETAGQCFDALFPEESGPAFRTELMKIFLKRADTRDRLVRLADLLCTALRDLILYAESSGERPGELLFFNPERGIRIAGQCVRSRIWESYRDLASVRDSSDANPNVPLMQNSMMRALYLLRQ